MTQIHTIIKNEKKQYDKLIKCLCNSGLLFTFIDPKQNYYFH